MPHSRVVADGIHAPPLAPLESITLEARVEVLRHLLGCVAVRVGAKQIPRGGVDGRRRGDLCRFLINGLYLLVVESPASYFTSILLSLICAEKIPELGLHTLPLTLGPRGVPGDSGAW